jgi:hypothetical protein
MAADVALPDFGILVDYGGRDVRAILAACGLETRRAGVPKAAAAKVDADHTKPPSSRIRSM